MVLMSPAILSFINSITSSQMAAGIGISRCQVPGFVHMLDTPDLIWCAPLLLDLALLFTVGCYRLLPQTQDVLDEVQFFITEPD
jgi:uncharacterized Rmd1/YagE family protein